MRAIAFPFALALAAAQPAAAADRAAQNAVDMVRAALEKGYGRTCSLANEPVERGGYWPCLDIGPYRFVAGYGRTTAFVVVEGQAPYPILVSENGEAEFQVRGRWQSDIGPRVATWWNDEVLGERSRRDEQEQGDGRRRAAESQVERMSPGGPPPEPERDPEFPSRMQPPPQVMPFPVQQVPQRQAPQPAYQQEPPQPAYQQPQETPPRDDALRSRPIPGPAPQGGVVLAPGVVGYPNGIPGTDARRR